MKISVKNLSKSYNSYKVIDNVSLEFKDYNFYAVCGPSGCGKSTLLNILSLINEPDPSSEIYYDTQSFTKASEETKRNFRIRNIGYIFQSFNLFEDDTVFNNVSLVVDSISNFSSAMKKRKIEEVLKQVDILNLEYKLVRNLSGGEKQRVAIARALVNNPQVIFADEPTGSLDAINSELIFSLLSKISANCIVICVTHDEVLAKKYSDYLLTFKDKKIEEVKNESSDIRKHKNLIMIERKRESLGILSEKFIFKHFISKVKVKKIRFLISGALLSISLLSIGLSVFLKNGISNSLKDSFSSIMNENSLVFTKKNGDTKIIDYYPSSQNEVMEIAKEYKVDIDYYGANYLVDFENFFKDKNYVLNISRGVSSLIDEINVRSFNEFNYIKDYKAVENIYPNLTSNLKNDEVVLSMNYSLMRRVCQYLQIERNFVSLGEYCRKGKFVINLNLGNNDWDYVDNISFLVKAVIISPQSRIYHTNNLFNEEVFEKTLMFPSSLNLKKTEVYPWVMKKIYYVKTKGFQSAFLNRISLDENYNNFLFDSDSFTYSPKNCTINGPNYTNKLFVYKVYKDAIPLDLASTIYGANSNLKNYYYSTSGGYINLGMNIFSGFVSETYFSLDREKLNSVIDSASHISMSNLETLTLPKGVLEGSALNTSDNVVRFSSKMTIVKKGKLPINLTEICISSALADKLGDNILNRELFISTIIKREEKTDYFKNYFRTIKINIVGIIESKKLLIYQDSSFSISLFRDLFQISSFNLLPNAIVFELDKKISQKELKKLNNMFSEYEFKNPLDNLQLGIEETLSYLEYILIALSIVTIISSVSLIIIINYIDVLEAKKDYAILVVLGYLNKEIIKMQFLDTLLPSLFSFFSGSISLIFVSEFLSKVLSETLGIETKVYTTLMPFILMFITTIAVTIFSTLASIKPIKQINIIKELHR